MSLLPFRTGNMLQLSAYPNFYLMWLVLDLLRRLRNLVSFPESRFEARPDETMLNKGEIHFVDYYPTDSGPLPTTENNSDVREGFSLYLPSDPEKLAQIRARFVLAPEEQE